MQQLRTVTRFVRGEKDIDRETECMERDVRDASDSNPWVVKSFQVVAAHGGGYLIIATCKRL